MDQQFEKDVMNDLNADPAISSVEEPFIGDSFEDEFEADEFEESGLGEDGMELYDEGDEAYSGDYFGEEEDEFSEGMDSEFSNGFAEEEFDLLEALEAAAANALDAEDSDEFVKRLKKGVRGIAGAVRRGRVSGGRMGGRAKRRKGVAGRRGVQSGLGQLGRGGGYPGGVSDSNVIIELLQQILAILNQHLVEANESELFEDLADWFEQEEADAALPVLSGIAAREALMPLIRKSGVKGVRELSRQLVKGASHAARTLINNQGPGAVRALAPIGRSIGRTAARKGLKPSALPGALRQTGARVAAQPSLTKRLSRSRRRYREGRGGRNRLNRLVISGGGAPRRLVVNGRVEIIIRPYK